MASHNRRRPPPLLPRADLVAAINGNGGRPAQKGRPDGVIDGHVHLWASREIIDSLSWMHATEQSRAATRVVQSNHGADRYLAAGGPSDLAKRTGASYQGSVYVQIEAEHSRGDWKHALREIQWLCETQLPHVPFKAIIPWAPLDEGRQAMAEYHAQLLDVVPSQHRHLIKGFRFLLQDFAPGKDFPMIQEDFIDSLRWLGEQGFSFDCTVDAQTFGTEVLADVVRAVDQVKSQGHPDQSVRIVLDHLCKPDYRVALDEQPGNFLNDYERYLTQLALSPSISLKFSGFLNYLPQQLAQDAFKASCGSKESVHTSAYRDCKKALKAFLLPLIESFGDERIFWGSDWPVSKLPTVTASTPEEEQSQVWHFTYQLALDTLREIGLPDESLQRIFSQNARNFYRIA